MRIHSIEIENITSLKGKHFIDFDSGLHGEELFAITGPTGAGKSSLLSSISLSLYGKTYKGSLASQDFVTTGSPYARTSLKFSLGGKRYVANWSIKVMKNNGEAIKNPKPQRELICEGVALEQTQISDILGLDFDQFCKTIILNQGEFARFLHSSFRERKDIIEKLYRTGELSQLSKILKEKVKEEESNYALQSLSYEKSLPYTEEEVSAITCELKEKLKILSVHEGLVELYTPAHKDLKELFNLLVNEKENQQRIFKSKRSLEAFTTNWNKLKENLKEKEAVYKKASTLLKTDSPKIREAIKHLNNIEHANKELHQLSTEKKDKESKLAILTDKLNSLETESHKLKEELTKLHRSYCHQKLFHSKSKNEIYVFKEGIEKLENYLNELSRTKSQIDLLLRQRKQQKDNLEHSIRNTELQLTTIEEYLGSRNIDLVDFFEEERRNREALISLWTKFSSEAVMLKEKLINQIKYISKKEIILNEVKDLENELHKLNLLKEKHQLEQAIKICASQAKLNGECPVCKNTEVSNLQKLKNVNFDQVRYENLREELQRRYVQLEQIDSDIDALDSELVKLNNNLEKKKEQLFPGLKDKLNWDTSADVEQGIKILKELHQKNRENALFIQEKLEKAKRELEREKSIQTESKSILDDLNLQVQDFQNDRSKIEHQIDTFLNTWKEILDDKNAEQVVKDFYNDIEIFNRYIQCEQKHNSCCEKQTLYKAQKTELNDRLIFINQRQNELSVQLQTEKEKIEQSCGKHNPIALLEKLENAEESSRNDYEEIKEQVNLVEKQKNNEEQSIRVYNEQVEELHNIQKITISKLKIGFEKLYSYSNDIPENYELRVECLDILSSSKKWMQLPANTSYEELLPILETRLETIWAILMEKLKDVTINLKTSVATNKTKIEDYNKKLDERAGLEKEIEKLKISLELKKKLLDIFGKDEFRSYALGLLEEELVMGANQELNQLCDGRYQLKLLPGKGSQMEFFVLDQWRDSTLRKISTLSGGETFLVSLAMALALAELTRGQNEIDSFFIDEGFGHLDIDSIDEVLEVLMTIQNRGKQIGIISHVKTLTDRIPVNLRLQKSSLGESETEFVYN